MLRWIAGVAVALACAAPCAASPTVVPAGRLRRRPGPVLQGPGRRRGRGQHGPDGPEPLHGHGVPAQRTRRWVNVRRAGCGNCDLGTQPVRLQADGTFGPIGVIGDDYWAVDQAGREVRGCSGAVLADGTCILVQTRFVPPTGLEIALVSQRGGAELWRLVEPGLGDWVPEGDVAPYVVRDGGGTAYIAYGQDSPRRDWSTVDSATGALRAGCPARRLRRRHRRRRPGREAFAGRLVAVGADGAQRWSAPRAELSLPLPPERGRQPRAGARLRGPDPPGEPRPLAHAALDAAPGGCSGPARRASGSRPLSLANGGLLLAGVEQGSSRSLRALGGGDGRARWTFRTSGLVVGARELTDRTIVASTAAAPRRRPGAAVAIDPSR